MKHIKTTIKKKVLLFFLVLLGPFSWAQQVSVTGTVTDAGSKESLPGVNVVVKGTTNGTTTNMNGKYTLKAKVGDVLEYTFIGFKKVTRPVVKGGVMNVALEEEASVLDEVVVVGYGSSTKKEITGAASKVKGAEVKKLNVARVDQALQGAVSGVQINTNSGSPGGASSIRIRGLSTFGDNDPLILVDGIVYDSEGLNALNPNDIESVNVLKDATAGIYGVRAANGVIIIETKQGTTDSKPTFEFSGFYGLQQTSNRLDLLNATEYGVVKNNAFRNGGDPVPFANPRSLGEGTDWQEEVFQTAPIQSYNFTMNGGGKKSRYSIGGSYFSQDGIVGGDKANFTRYNVRLNYSYELAKNLRLNNVALYTNESRSTLPENGIGSVLYNTVNAYPTAPVFNEEQGRFDYLENVDDIINPIPQIENTFNDFGTNKLVGKQELVYTINENFTFTNRINYNVALTDGKVFSPLVWYGPGKAQNTAANENLDAPQVEIADSVFLDRGASVYEERNTFVDITGESYLNYERTFNEIHKVKSTLGLSVFERSGNGLNGTAFNIPNNSIDFADISASQADGGLLNSAGSFEFEERLLSAFFRAEYSYKNRYLLSGVLRRDGSSRFGANNRWGTFPAVSAAWVFSDEEFFNVKNIDFAKLRLSYGVSGNDQIPNFAYLAILNGEAEYVFNDIITQGVALGRGANPDLKWETTAQFNAGLDLTFYRNWNMAANYFVKNTRDLLFQPTVSGILGTYGPGGFPPFVNAGDVQNRGFELELGYQNVIARDWTINANINMTQLTNEVLAVPDGVDFIPGAQFGVGGNIATRFEVGQPIGYFIGYETDGIFQNQEEIDNAAVTQAGAQPGDLRFVDQNGDGEINFSDESDLTRIGSPIPDFTFGFNFRVAYKGIDLSANLYAAIGQEIIRNYERQQPFANQLGYTLNRWAGEGSSNEVPRQTTGTTRNNVFSDFYVEDGSFLRVRNIQVGYTLPKEWVNWSGAAGLRVYLSANNPFTFTNYQGFDPDIGNFGGPLSAGIDYGFYPQPRTIMGGFNLNF
jgi:TonB-linked SusC/RagA family outer membrane protein